MKKATHLTDRATLTHFQQIINVGPATADDFRTVGLKTPQQLIGKDPWRLYRKLCTETELKHDPCVLDVFMSAIDYMEGGPPQAWWKFTAARKKEYASRLEKLAGEFE